jgi:hypothetical protein
MEVWVSMWIPPNSVSLETSEEEEGNTCQTLYPRNTDDESPYEGNLTRGFGEGRSIQVLKEDHWDVQSSISNKRPQDLRHGSETKPSYSKRAILMYAGNQLGHQRRVLPIYQIETLDPPYP